MRWRGTPQQARSPGQRGRRKPSLQLHMHLQKPSQLPLKVRALQLNTKWHRLQQWSFPVAWKLPRQRLVDSAQRLRERTASWKQGLQTYPCQMKQLRRCTLLPACSALSIHCMLLRNLSIWDSGTMGTRPHRYPNKSPADWCWSWLQATHKAAQIPIDLSMGPLLHT